MKKSFQEAKEKQEELFVEIANLLGALASPVRLKIFHFLTQAPHSVEQLASKLGQTVANTSMHLKKLQREKLLKVESDAQKRIYSLTRPEMKDFWEQILEFAAIHDPENTLNSAQIYGEDLDWHQSLEETAQLILARKVTLIDVRPQDELNAKEDHYQKYVTSIPFDAIKEHIEDIPKNRPVLIICRGRLCIMANEITSLLRKKNLNAFRLKYSWHQLSSLLS